MGKYKDLFILVTLTLVYDDSITKMSTPEIQLLATRAMLLMQAK